MCVPVVLKTRAVQRRNEKEIIRVVVVIHICFFFSYFFTVSFAVVVDFYAANCVRNMFVFRLRDISTKIAGDVHL